MILMLMNVHLVMNLEMLLPTVMCLMLMIGLKLLTASMIQKLLALLARHSAHSENSVKNLHELMTLMALTLKVLNRQAVEHALALHS